MIYFNRVFVFIIILLTIYCSKDSVKINYKSISIENEVTQFFTDKVFKVGSVLEFKSNVFFVSYPDVWVADLKKKEVKLLFKKGIGPEEIYWVNQLNSFNNEIYINSFWPLKYIYHFNPESDKKVLNKLEIPVAISFDDFCFISPEQLILVNVQWEDGDLVRIYDLKTGKYQSIEKRHYTPIMKKFNVNIASICIMNNLIYVVQTISPEILVISISERKLINKLELSPPFYRPMPVACNVKKFDLKQLAAWNAQWTSLCDITGKDGWLLATFQTWVNDEIRYYYELINVQHPSNRYFINETPYLIYNFQIARERIHLDICEIKGESLIWLKANAHLY